MSATSGCNNCAGDEETKGCVRRNMISAIGTQMPSMIAQRHGASGPM
jgi:hypothetical protein